MLPSLIDQILNPPSDAIVYPPIVAGANTIWSTFKLNPSYVGPAIQIKRASDNATMDIPFNGNVVDSSTINSFTSNGSIAATVIIVYDQTGNGNHLTVESTFNAGTLVYDAYYGNYFVRFETELGGTPGTGHNNTSYQIPDAVLTPTQGFTSYTIIRGLDNSAEAFYDLGTSVAADKATFYQHTTTTIGLYDGAQTDFATGGLPYSGRIDFFVQSVISDATSARLNIDGLGPSFSAFKGTSGRALTSVTAGGGVIGRLRGFAAGTWQGFYDFGGMILYNSALSTGNDAINHAALLPRFKKTAQYTKVVTLLGDSETASRSKCFIDLTWPVLLFKQYSNSVRFVNTGISGQTSANILADVTRATNQTTWGYQGGGFTNKVCIFNVGVNDVITGVTAATCWSNIQSIVTALKANYTHVIMWDILPCPVFTAPQNTTRSTINASILSGYAALGVDTLIQTDSLGLVIGDFYSDQTHLVTSGNAKIYAAIKTALDALI